VSQMTGCPILRVFCEGWDTTALPPRPFPRIFCYPTLRKKREGWGTRSPVTEQEITAFTSDALRLLVTCPQVKAFVWAKVAEPILRVALA
jgi:hypothetical protein